MSHISVDQSLELDDPFLVEGLPGVGLVGKIAADHIADEFGMSHYAACECDGLPDVAVFEENEHDVKPPVRILADEDSDLLVLQSDVPVSPERASCFAGCLNDWVNDIGATPIYLSGLPRKRENESKPAIYGVSTGDSSRLLTSNEVRPPEQGGIVSGPTGALLKEAQETGTPSVGLIAESYPQFPDPAAARVLIEEGISRITGTEIGTAKLVERSEEIIEKKERLAKQMQDAEEESTSATPVGMYQ